MSKITTNCEAKMKNTILYISILILICSNSLAQSIDQRIRNFSESTQSWLVQSCPKSLGPSLWNVCMEREIAALNQGMPDSKTMSSADRVWLEQSCPSMLGPSLFKICMEREKNAINQGMPNLDKLSTTNKAWVLESCPRMLGPSLFKTCVLREANSLR